MLTFLRRRQPAALIVAIVALVAAVGGTAIAGPDAFTSVSKKKTKKIAKKEAKKLDRKQDRRNFPTSNIANAAVTGSKLAPESVGASKLTPIRTVSAAAVIPLGTTGSATANCDPDERLIGGGHQTELSTTSALIVQENLRTPAGNGWRVGGLADGGPVNLTVMAYCLEQTG